MSHNHAADAAPPQAAPVMPGAASSPIAEAIRRACARIAPTWPLDQFIAVNPFWGLIDTPLPEVAAQLRALCGARLLMPRAWYRQALEEGRLGDEHLVAALAESAAPIALADLRALLRRDEPQVPTRARVVDVVDEGRDLRNAPSWRSFVTHSISQCCAAYFDEGQATLAPIRQGGLYASWRRQALRDRSPALLMGLAGYRRQAQELPETAQRMIDTALAALAIPTDEQERYLWSLLLDQNGWASYCAYHRWLRSARGAASAGLTPAMDARRKPRLVSAVASGHCVVDQGVEGRAGVSDRRRPQEEEAADPGQRWGEGLWAGEI